jgi:uncharacterized membrane protein SpoIIM required for sporulation
MWWFGKLPSIITVRELLDLVNSKGGNITLLLVCTLIGSGASLRLFYYIIQLSVDGKIQQDNVFTIMSLTFITGTITGNFMGALLKTMTGDTIAPGRQEVKTEESKTSVLELPNKDLRG